MSELTPEAAASIRDRIAAGARAIDVRSDAGRASAGSLDGATVVLKEHVAAFAETLDKDEELVVFCGTTAGSGPVVDWLDDNGFTNVAHVDGGFEALKDAGLPTTAPAHEG